MKNKIVNIIICSLACLMTCLSSCKDDDTLSVSYMYKHKLVSVYTEVVDLNQVKLIWYKVNNAVSYTIQISFDEFFQEIYHEETVTGLSYLTPELPYASNVYIRMRTNAQNEANNSIWYEFSVETDERDIPPVLNEIDGTLVREDNVTITWVVDPENFPVDSISVEKQDEINGNEVVQQIMLTEEESLQGSYVITDLEKATTYKVTLCNSKVESLFDRPYNSVTFKTAGAEEGDITITSGQDLSAILKANESDAMIFDGQRYYIQDEGTYNLAGYEFTKGFELTAAPGKNIVVNITNPFTPVEVVDGAAGKITFNNLQLTGETLLVDNAKEDGLNYTWKGLEVNGCTLSALPGLVRLNTSEGNLKRIMNILVSNCVLNEMGSGKLISVENHPNKDKVVAAVDALSITQSTISNSPNFLILGFPDNYGYSGSTIMLVMQNVTIFESCTSARMIAMNRLTDESQVFINHCLFSNVKNNNGGNMFYETCLAGSATKTFEENYRTTELPETGRGGNVATVDLGLTQEELFMNPATGDLTIKDKTSVVYVNEIGDSRWLK